MLGGLLEQSVGSSLLLGLLLRDGDGCCHIGLFVPVEEGVLFIVKLDGVRVYLQHLNLRRGQGDGHLLFCHLDFHFGNIDPRPHLGGIDHGKALLGQKGNFPLGDGIKAGIGHLGSGKLPQLLQLFVDVFNGNILFLGFSLFRVNLGDMDLVPVWLFGRASLQGKGEHPRQGQPHQQAGPHELGGLQELSALPLGCFRAISFPLLSFGYHPFFSFFIGWGIQKEVTG